MKRRILAATLTAVLAGTSPVVFETSVSAQGIAVFDPANYAQNVLTAARTLRQIDQQILSLQNEAAMLTNMAKNLSRVDFPQLDRLRRSLAQVDRLMENARGVDYGVDRLDDTFRRLFPNEFDRALSTDRRVREARDRLDASTAGLRQTMTIQSQVVENVRDDATTLAQIVDASQGAEGGLQAAQATNQLLALATKQQFQLQQMMAAQFRSDAVDRARRLQESGEARAATRRFFGARTGAAPR